MAQEKLSEAAATNEEIKRLRRLTKLRRRYRRDRAACTAKREQDIALNLKEYNR
jgi:hypothetical protein